MRCGDRAPDPVGGVMRLRATVLDSADARRLARFYARLLEWPIEQDLDGWVTLRDPQGGAGLSFSTEDAYEPPAWPSAPGAQQQMLHLDIAVDDLPAAVALAVALGAREAAYQPQEHVRVLFDPDGHPFCLFLPEA